MFVGSIDPCLPPFSDIFSVCGKCLMRASSRELEMQVDLASWLMRILLLNPFRFFPLSELPSVYQRHGRHGGAEAHLGQCIPGNGHPTYLALLHKHPSIASCMYLTKVTKNKLYVSTSSFS